jgi:hypothetical protein
MNRNHQGRNDQNRTNQGRHHLAYDQSHRPEEQRSHYDSYARRFNNHRPYEDRLRERMKKNERHDWESQMNKPDRERWARHMNTGVIDEWDTFEEPTSMSDNYESFHQGIEPVQISARERLRHDRVQNAARDFHDQGLSYRALSERHPERFLGEEYLLNSTSEPMPDISYAGLGPKGYRRSDSSLEEEVCEILTQDPYIDASEIFVAVEDGIVKLSGLVDDREERFEIERAVDGIWGVEDILNDIKVKRRTMTKTRH